MNAVEFTVDLSEKPHFSVPKDVADKLPKSGKARVIILIEDDLFDVRWKSLSYREFLREDSSEDAIYDSLK